MSTTRLPRIAGSKRSAPGRRRLGVPFARSVYGGLAGIILSALLPTAANAYPRPGGTEWVSVAFDGAEANSFSSGPAISADGRHVAFRSDASNLVPGDTNGARDVFVHDRATGASERVSVVSDGAEANDDSFDPTISADGRYVAFASSASNLVPGDTNSSWDVFVHDLATGRTERVSVAPDGAEGDSSSYDPAISADGGHVAFHSSASNLVPADTNMTYDVFVHDLATGRTERVSVASDGAQANANSFYPAISADGRHVAFHSNASNLVPGDTNMTYDVFVHDLATGRTERVSVAPDGAEGDSSSYDPAISADGGHVAFHSSASNLVPADTNRASDTFVHDLATGITERVSVASDGAEANTEPYAISSLSAISANGRHVAFWSHASNLVPGDTNGTYDVFVHDRATGATERISVTSDGAQVDPNSISSSAVVSADGRYVAFESLATGLVPGETNGHWHVFVHDRGPATGIGRLSAARAPDRLAVSGWVTFSGAVVASAEDAPADGQAVARDLGGEIVGATVTYRPEDEDLLLRLRLVSLPAPVVGGAPGVLYRWALTVGDVEYEVRAMRAAATAVPPAAPYFALYAGDTEVTRLSGGIGTTGPEVRVAVPLTAVGASEGVTLSGIAASTSLGEAATGPLVVLDDVSLPDAPLPVARVDLGLAPAAVGEPDVTYSTEPELFEGRLSGTVPTAGLPAGTYRVWARACLGDVCGTRSVAVTL